MELRSSPSRVGFKLSTGIFATSLTAMGVPAPNLHIAKPIGRNQFKIAGGKPRMRVSWQVTGIRQDAWANAHRIPVEQNKTVKERDRYLHPELVHKPESKRIHLGHAPEFKPAKLLLSQTKEIKAIRAALPKPLKLSSRS
jgi:hypothetical protein